MTGLIISDLDKKKIEITCEKHPDYKRIYASGFWGGLTPAGDLTFDIFEEYQENPSKLVITPPSKPGEMPKEKAVFNGSDDVLYMKRLLHIGVTLPISVVPSIIEWLQGKVDQYNEIQKNIQEMR
ncbi:MAG: hypothetical protein QHH02_03370 [Syntrophomonadaceae bacterium]|jgi:hypothetical protein|nr:hypothetical protein [Syntrophomonadaceae bacterium]